MEVLLLGPVRVVDDRGEEVPLGAPKQRAVLAALALEAGRVVGVASLVRALWADSPPGRAEKVVQTHVSTLRRAGLKIETAGVGYRLVGVRVDVDAVELAVAQASTLEPSAASAELRAALGRWRGPSLADANLEGLLAHEAARLEERRLELLDAATEADLEAGRCGELVGDLLRRTAERPERPRPWIHLALALHRSGRTREAISALQRHRRHLVDAAGLEPSAAVRDLEVMLLAGDPSVDTPPPRADVAVLPPALATRSRDTFVGRGAELALVIDAWHRAETGSPQLVLVTGEAGIGKTRLAAEVASAVRAAGGTVLAGRAVPGVAAPFAPWSEALSPAVSAMPIDALERLASGPGWGIGGVVPLVERRLQGSGRPHPDPTTREPSRLGTFEAVADVLRAAAVVGAPTVLVLDDAPWLDASSIELLRHVLQPHDPAPLPLLVLLTARRGVGSPIDLLVADRERAGGVDRIHLDGLTTAEVSRLAGAAGAGALHAETGGNPLFVELVTGAGRIGRPATPVHEVVGVLVGDLPAAGRQALEAVAVLGHADLAEIAAVVRLEEVAALDGLESALAAGLIRDDPGTGCSVTHGIVRQAVLDALSGPRLAVLHRRAAGVAREQAGALHHLLAAGGPSDLRAAVDAAAAASRGALEVAAWEEAVRFAEVGERAAEAIGAGRSAHVAELRLLRAHALRRLGRPAEARTLLEDAVEIAREAHDAQLLGAAAAALPTMSRLATDDGTTDAALGDALDAVVGTGTAVEARVLVASATWRAFVDPESGAAFAARAVDVAARARARPELVQARAAVLMTMPPGRVDLLEPAVAALTAAADDRHDHPVFGSPLVFEAHLALTQGDRGRASAALGRYASAAPPERDLLAAVMLSGHRAFMLVQDADIDAARTAMEDFLAASAVVLDPATHAANVGYAMTSLGFACGDLDAVVPVLAAMEDAAPELAVPRALRAAALAVLGDLEGTRTLLDRLVDEGALGRRNMQWPVTVAAMTTSAALCAHEEAAAAIVEALGPVAEGWAVYSCWSVHGPYRLHRGLALATLGRRAEALDDLRAAVGAAEAFGAAYWTWHAHDALGAVLGRSGAASRAAAQAALSAAGCRCQTAAWAPPAG